MESFPRVKPLSLMVLAGLTPPEWEITIVDENLGVPDYPAMPQAGLGGHYRLHLTGEPCL